MISVDAEIMPDVHPGEFGLGQYTSASLYRLITLDLSQEVHASNECQLIDAWYKETTNRPNTGKTLENQSKKEVVETSLKSASL